MLRDPWLVAAWPGMASVGTLAVRRLVASLGARNVLEMDPAPWFDLPQIQVKGGIVRGGRGPRTSFHEAALPSSPHDLVVVVAESQPTLRARAFADAVVDAAGGFGATRVVTFAAMAAPVDPSAPSRVFAAASAPRLLADVVEHGATALEGGEISGMNGALVGAALRKGIEGVCLLGEFPYFAGGVPNPKAAASVLRVFSRLSGAAVDVSDLDAQAKVVDRELAGFLERLSREAGEPGAAGEPPERHEAPEHPANEERETTGTRRRLSTEEAEKIERLFAAVGGDRSKALDLKAELDRLGAFGEYKDRFLDLFHRGE